MTVSDQMSAGRHLNYKSSRVKQETPWRWSLSHTPRCRDALSVGYAAYLGQTLRSQEPVLSNWYLLGHYSQ